MIKAIVFDYFGVVSSKESWEQVTSKLEAAPELAEAYVNLNMGAIHWQEFVDELSDITDTPSAVLQNTFEKEQINPNMLALVKHLKRKGLKTALLTNAHHEYIEPTLNEAHIDKVFDAIFISSRLRMVKPSAEIFKYTVNKLGVKPEEAIFVDDFQRNVTGAEAAGLTGVLYSDLEVLKHTLAELLSEPSAV